VLSPQERLELRKQALDLWALAQLLSSETERITRANPDPWTSAHARIDSRFLRESAVRRVKKAIDTAAALDRWAGSHNGVGLVAAERIERVGWLHDAIQQRVTRVCAAGDGPTAVGLAIVEQPDVAIIDGDLNIVDSLNTARAIRAYAPSTCVLLITSEPDVDREARADGIATQGPSASPERLLGALDALMDPS
jgi:CheY-like chemotaxis protein